MRWFASLVVLCLLAGTGPVRPQVRLTLREPGESSQTVAAADHALPLIAARRGGAPAPDLRREAPGPFTAPDAFVPPAPPPAHALEASRGPLAPVLLARAWAHAARGPPLGC